MDESERMAYSVRLSKLMEPRRKELSIGQGLVMLMEMYRLLKEEQERRKNEEEDSVEDDGDNDDDDENMSDTEDILSYPLVKILCQLVPNNVLLTGLTLSEDDGYFHLHWPSSQLYCSVGYNPDKPDDVSIVISKFSSSSSSSKTGDPIPIPSSSSRSFNQNEVFKASACLLDWIETEEIVMEEGRDDDAQEDNKTQGDAPRSSFKTMMEVIENLTERMRAEGKEIKWGGEPSLSYDDDDDDEKEEEEEEEDAEQEKEEEPIINENTLTCAYKWDFPGK